MQHAINNSSGITPFCAAGLYLVPIAPVKGKPSKAPRVKGWNKPRSQDNHHGYSNKTTDFKQCQGFNFGLYHSASRTLALDLDDLEVSIKVFEEATGIHLSDWLEDEDRIEIKSPKINRGKLLFKLPDGFDGIGLRQFKHRNNVVFELRSGNCQDVIHGEHPEGGTYRFIGNPAKIPVAPTLLLDLLRHWDVWKPCFDSALGIETIPPKIQPRKPLKDENIPGQRNPIEEFNQSNSVQHVLLANGYKATDKDRFIRPNSESKAPGVIILHNCTDGIDRAFSHGGDLLNDGFAHDAWDCYRLLECGGNSVDALNWNPKITKHNQKLFMQSKADAGQDKATKKPPKSCKQTNWCETKKDYEMRQNITSPGTQKTTTNNNLINSKDTTDAEKSKENENKLPDGTVLENSHIAILRKLNNKYTHVVFGGKNIIIGQKKCQVQGSVFTFEPLSEFKKRFLNESLIGNGKNQGDAWLRWPGKNYMPNGTGFYPDVKKCPNGVFNLFRGLHVKPIEGDCAIYLDHLKNIICAGDEVSYNYLIGWFAHLFQQPDVKPNVAIVLKSIEGTGKGTMASPILKILGSHGNQTNGAYAIAGRFNGLIASRLLIFADEVDLTDKHVADRLKGIISETSVNLERKGLEIEPLPNYCRLIFASNHTRVLNAGIRERRFLVLEPSSEKAQNSECFEKLWEWINDQGSAKLLHYLLSVDISEFNPYKCPQTKALIAEKLDNLGGINQFFYNEIMRIEPFAGKARISAHELVEDFTKWSKEEDIKINAAAARSLTGKMMVKLNIEVRGRSDRGYGKFYDLPNKSELVQVFADFLDIPVKELGL